MARSSGKNKHRKGKRPSSPTSRPETGSKSSKVPQDVLDGEQLDSPAPKARRKKKDPNRWDSLSNQWLGVIPVFFVLAMVIYYQTRDFGYVLDDDVVYLQNRHVQKGTDGISDILRHGFLHGFVGKDDQSYRPVILIVFALQKEYWDNDPEKQHLFNLFIYFLCGVVMWLLLRQMLRKLHPIYPTIATALFMAMPMHVEVVANIKGLDDLLNFLFLTTSLWLFMRYIRKGRTLHLVLSLMAYFTALLCKEIAVPFVVLFPLAYYFFKEPERYGPSFSFPKFAIASAGFVVALVGYLVLRSSILTDITFSEDMQIINNGLVAADSGMQRLSTALWMQVLYLGMQFLPLEFSCDYTFNSIAMVDFWDWQGLLTLAVLGGLAFFTLRGLTKKDPIAFGIIYYFITISVVSNVFILIGSTFGERFVFTASFGFCMALVLVVHRLLEKKTGGLSNPTVVYAIAALLIGYNTYKSYERTGDWESTEILWESALEVVPGSSRVQEAAGSKYRTQADRLPPEHPQRAGLFQQALDHYDLALDILPENFSARFNKGVVHQSMGQVLEAQEAFEGVLKDSPTFSGALNNLGVIYFNRKDFVTAMSYWQQLLAVEPGNLNGITNMGAAKENVGDYQGAIGYYLQAVQIQNPHQRAFQGLARCYANLGNAEQSNYYSQLAQTNQPARFN